LSPPDESEVSRELLVLWSPEHRVIQERQLWLAVLRAQKDLGLPLPGRVIEDYEQVLHQVDLPSITAREKRSRHDVKARIEEFNDLAGHEHIHKGLTSCDVTDNITQVLVRDSVRHLRARALALPGQTSAEHEGLREATARLGRLLDTYPLRGIKGPVGTAQDMLDLLGTPDRLAALERLVADHLGFSHVLPCVGQIYPRSLDHQVASTVVLFAGTLIAAAGTGSRPRQQRLREQMILLRGYASMHAEIAGNQWNEGDVSCSVVRRVALPGLFFAADGVLTATVTEYVQ
jgi:adenylosuccinate lyase